MALPRIRPMTPADVEPVVAAFIRADWGDRRSYLDFATRHPETHPFVAEAESDIVGTGVLSVNGSVGWIGTIWVEPAWRRRGVGMALTQVTIDTAESAGCRHLRRAVASPETGLSLVRDDGTLGGFVVRAPWGGGSTIAPRLDDAEAILHARRVGRSTEQRIRAGLVVENTAGLERLLATGWTDSWGAPRLIRGDPLNWQPESIWGQFNHALG